jgi:hypothetical protein
MTPVEQCLNIILEQNFMEISTHNYMVVIRGHLKEVGLDPRFGTSIFDRVFLEITFQDRAHAELMSRLPRFITS